MLADVARAPGRQAAQAYQAARRALELAPAQAYERIQLVRAARRAGHTEEARAAAEEACALDPTSRDAREARGWLAAREGDWPAAEAAYRAAVELAPRAAFY